jgi:two-component system chemotaxis response regulator CheY
VTDIVESRSKILVCDDSRVMRKIVVRELTGAAIELADIVEASSGLAAIESVRAGGIGFVLCDWFMPGLDGLTVLTILRSEGYGVPFGFITAEYSEQSRQLALDAGAAFLINKPFAGPDLIAKMEAAKSARDKRPEGWRRWRKTPVRQDDAAEERRRADVAEILNALIDATVTTQPSDEPSPLMPQVIARYVNAELATTALCALEFNLAASLGGALSGMPPDVVEKCYNALRLPSPIEENVREITNVLSQVARPDDVRCVLADLKVFTSLELHPILGAERAEYQARHMWVFPEGYPPGRLSLVSV